MATRRKQREQSLRPPPADGYGIETAGRLMSTDVTTLAEALTVDQALDELRRHLAERTRLYYAYVTDEKGRLTGVLSMRDLILAPPTAPLSRVMRRDLVCVGVDDDREYVANVLARYRYVALPVVDASRRLLGVVTVDDVLDVFVEEATEDIHRLFAAGSGELLTSPWHFSFRKRLPWLLVNLVLAASGALVVRLFEGTIAAWTALAVYMPVVAGMGGNASAQAMAVSVRGIALGEASRVRVRAVIGRELRVGLASGLVTGALAFVAVTLVHPGEPPLLGGLVAVSLVVSSTAACAWGAAVPFLMEALGFDPAQSATIFTTVLTDALGFLTLLGLATLSISLLG